MPINTDRIKEDIQKTAHKTCCNKISSVNYLTTEKFVHKNSMSTGAFAVILSSIMALSSKNTAS